MKEKIKAIARYAETKEWKEIVKTLIEKKEIWEEKVLNSFVTGKVDNTAKYSTHDRNYKIIELLREIKEMITLDEEWAELIREKLQEDIDMFTRVILVKIQDEYGLLLSDNKYTDLDIQRYLNGQYEHISIIAKSMQDALEKPEATDIAQDIYKEKKEEEKK